MFKICRAKVRLFPIIGAQLKDGVGVLPLRVSGALPEIGQLRPLIKAVAQ
jgi:hypothetical protein